MSEEQTRVEPADAALLREVADQMCSRYTVAYVVASIDEKQAMRIAFAARLRALAGVLEQSRNGHIACMCDACYHARLRER